MSNSTRARKERNIQDRVSESLTEVDKAFIAELKRFSDASNSTAGDAGASANNSPTSPAGNYLFRPGDAMIGPLALSPPLDFTIDIDEFNTINISPLNGNTQYSSNLQLEDVPTSTTLNIISGSAFDGQILILRTFAPNPITISQGTVNNGGNIQTPDSNDVTLGDLQMVILVFDEALVINENTGGTWRLFNTFGTGGDEGYNRIQDGGINVSQRNTMNFIGTGVTAVDNPGESRTDITIAVGGGGGEFFGPWTADHDAGGFKLNNSSGIDLFANSVANSVSSASFINFDSDAGTFRGALTRNDESPYTAFDTGLILDVPSNNSFSIAVNSVEVFKFDGTNSKLLTQFQLDMNSNEITNALFVESNTADRPGEGFLRMASTDQVIWRDVQNTDNLFIDVQRPDLGEGPVTQDAFAFTVASGVQMYIGEFDISVQQNDIIETGDVLPSGTGGEVGDATHFYNQMHSQFFVPEAAGIVNSRFGFAKNSDLLYVNFDDSLTATFNAGFGIFGEGLQRFLFRQTVTQTAANTPPPVNEFFIGGDPETAGETYLISMGNNSNSSAEIKFVEGGDNLIINRKGVTSTKGVELQTGNIAILRTTSTTVQFLKNADLDDNDIINVVNITSDGNTGASTGTIGELITADGGFNYFIRDTLAWDQDANVKLTFSSNGITLETNGSTDNIDIKTPGTSSEITIRAASDGFFSMGLGGINHLQFGSGITTFSTANINLTSGAKEIQFLDAVAGTSATTPLSGDINLFNDLTTGELSVKKFGGAVISLEGGDVSQWSTFDAIQDVDMGTFDLFNIDNLVFNTGTGSLLDAEPGYTSVATGGLRANILNGAEFRWTEEGVELMRLSESDSTSITTLEVTGILSAEITLSETTASKSGTILQGATTLQYSTSGTNHEFLVGVESIATITDQGIIMQGTNFIKTPQIGFNDAGNIIESTTSGLSIKTAPSDVIGFGDGTNVFATTDNSKFDIGLRFYQLGSIASPGVTGSTTLGRIFMDTNNLNHLSIIRNGSIIDLESGGGDPNGGIQDFELMLDDISIDGNVNDVYITNSKQGNVAGDTTTLFAGIVTWVPVYVNRNLTARNLAFNYITAVAGTGAFTMGIYDNIGSGENYPDVLLDSASGSISTTIESKTVTIFISLTPGLYWLAIVASHPNTTTIGVTQNSTEISNCVGYFDDDDGTKVLIPILGYVDSATFLPSTAPGNMDILSANPPALFLRMT